MIKQINKILCLAPHTDDIEFGCGATVARFLEEGCEVRLVAFSDCKESIPKGFAPNTLEMEMKDAAHTLGLKDENVMLLDYSVRYFSRDRQSILEDLVKIKKDFNPDLVFTPSRQDIHQDHSTVTNEAIRAFKSKTILGYELPWNCLTLPSNTIINVEERHVDSKIKSIKCYKSQGHRSYSDENYIKSLAVTRGARVGFKFGEAFDLIRLIVT